MPRDSPGDGRVQFNRGGSLRSRCVHFQGLSTGAEDEGSELLISLRRHIAEYSNLQEAFSCFQVAVTFQIRNMLSAAPKTMKEAGSAIFKELRAAYITPRELQSEKVPQHSMFRVRQRVLHLHTKLRNTILVEKLIKIFQCLWDLKFSYSVHNTSSPNPALSYLNPVTHIFKMRLHFYPLRSRTSDLPRGPFRFRIFDQIPVCTRHPTRAGPPTL